MTPPTSGRRRPRFTTAEYAVAQINDGATLSVEGSGGGLLEPDQLLAALGQRFDETGSPRDLCLTNTTGIGDRQGGGLDRIAREGLLKRVVSGNWGMAPAMSRLAMEGKFEAYNLPQGVLAQLYREIAGGRPGLITHVGLGMFCDPRLEGGKLNDVTTEELVELIELDGRHWLYYRSFPIDVCFLRATTADEDGNLSLEQEAARLETLAIAQATRNSGGLVIAQVKRTARAGTLDPRTVVVPGMLVDLVVVHPAQWQTVAAEYEPAYSGEVKAPLSSLPPLPLDHRKVIARRALQELRRGDVVNLGVGMADGIAAVAAEEGCQDDIILTIEQGLVGGIPALGVIFGVSLNPEAILDQPAQFDFYDGGGLDITFLGCAQVDGDGNVNVSKFGPRLVGTGGFVNISQNAGTVVFLGTFTSGGLQVKVGEGAISIVAEGRHRKFVEHVDQITFSAAEARRRGQRVVYVTERAVFQLGDDGLELIEVAPGIDLETDVLACMDFTPKVTGADAMPEAVFGKDPMGWVMPDRAEGARTDALKH